MARIEFTSFKEASEFSRKLSQAISATTTVRREGAIWWVDDLRNDDDFEGQSAKTNGNLTHFRRLTNLPDRLKKRIMGQDNAIDAVCRRLRIADSGLSRRSGPRAVFLCIGPSGVGKTELAKSLATDFLGGEQFLIRLDMSEYMEEHSISKLIGSPPGYVGYDNHGQLTEKLKALPRSLLLLDEVEKAHPRVMDIFLQLFGEGRITDSRGKTVDASKTIVIMTSNIRIEESARIGFGASDLCSDEIKLDALKKYFRTEFINRFDEVVIFNRLERDSIRLILAPLLDELRTNLKKLSKAELVISDDVVEMLIEEGYEPDFGARELKRTVEKYLQAGLSELMMHGKIPTGSTVTAGISDSGIAFSVMRAAQKIGYPEIAELDFDTLF